jgi:hypothetical protein
MVEQANVGNQNFGAIFGVFLSTPDIVISSHPPTKKCSTNFGLIYKLPDGYIKDTGKARNLLAGSYEFTPSEIEVFYQVKQGKLAEN